MKRRYEPGRIRIFRVRRDLSQQDLAKRTGWTQERISRLERGLTQPTPDDLEILRTALELPNIESLYRPLLCNVTRRAGVTAVA